MATIAGVTAERVSVGVGLCLVMLATLPRYIAGGFDTRQLMLTAAIVIVAVVMTIQWRLLDQASRQRLPTLFKRLLLALVAGNLVMLAWNALTSDFYTWQIVLSHGTTLGLLLHALILWWQPATETS